MGTAVVNKDVLAKYVHDVVEMEAAIYTLDKSLKECEEKKADIIADANGHCRYALDNLKSAEQDLKHIEEKGYISPIQEPQKVNSNKGCSGCISSIVFSLGALFAVTFIIVIVNSFTGNTMDGKKMGAIGAAVFYVSSIIIYFVLRVFNKISDKKANAKAMKKFQQDLQKGYREYQIDKEARIQECHEEIRRRRAMLENAEKSRQVKYEQAELIALQIKNIKEKTQKIKSNLANLYSYDIIPPDYRYMDCEIILDQIFRNDLADTMREAIKIYEERVFRGSVIRGMDRIVSMLGNLSNEMSAISLRLDMINSSVVQMGDDLSKANQRLMNNQRELIEQSIKNHTATEKLINETKLGRYTNEKLLESNEILAKYATDKRLGII